MASPPRAPSPELAAYILEVENRYSIPQATGRDIARENYEATKLWIEAIAIPKSKVIEDFQREVRQKQFKHILRAEPRIPKPKGN